MKCQKCGEKNISSANYCIKCGNSFSDKKRREYRKKTVVGKLELMEKIYDTCKLKFITDSIAFKVISLIAVLLVGIYFLVNTSNDVKILTGNDYDVQYNSKDKEYYILVNDDEVNLKLYIPNRLKSLELDKMSGNNELLNETKYKEEDSLILNVNDSEEYYLLKAFYGKDTQNLKIYVYRKDN